jgi:hypothetical protein
VPSTLTGRNEATPGTTTFARPPGGDVGNDSESLAEALTMGHGEGDGGCKGASNG